MLNNQGRITRGESIKKLERAQMDREERERSGGAVCGWLKLGGFIRFFYRLAKIKTGLSRLVITDVLPSDA